jgi:hypothetical protein
VATEVCIVRYDGDRFCKNLLSCHVAGLSWRCRSIRDTNGRTMGSGFCIMHGGTVPSAWRIVLVQRWGCRRALSWISRDCCPQDLSSSFCHGRENEHHRFRSVLRWSLRLILIWKNPAVDSASSHLWTLQNAHWQILHAFNLRLRLSTFWITWLHLSLYPVQIPYAWMV